MAKSRRKADIRNRATAQLAARRATRYADWRAVFLDALVAGASAVQAARLTGVTRSRAYNERMNHDFDDA